ncbi:MAG: hypothetical protein AVDCRST_MAG66-86, partial [uncultured Pseudonocardia sp.]
DCRPRSPPGRLPGLPGAVRRRARRAARPPGRPPRLHHRGGDGCLPARDLADARQPGGTPGVRRVARHESRQPRTDRRRQPARLARDRASDGR